MTIRLDGERGGADFTCRQWLRYVLVQALQRMAHTVVWSVTKYMYCYGVKSGQWVWVFRKIFPKTQYGNYPGYENRLIDGVILLDTLNPEN